MLDLLVVSFTNDLTTSPVLLQAKEAASSRECSFAPAWASRVVLVVKTCLPVLGDVTDVGSIPGSGSSPGGGHGNPLQYSCMENPMDRRAWGATVHGVKELDTIEAI